MVFKLDILEPKYTQQAESFENIFPQQTCLERFIYPASMSENQDGVKQGIRENQDDAWM